MGSRTYFAPAIRLGKKKLKKSFWDTLMSSSNMINAESPQFTQSSLAPSLSVFIFCPNVKNINWGELLSLKTGCWNTHCNLKKMWGCNLNFLVYFQIFHFSLLSEILKYKKNALMVAKTAFTQKPMSFIFVLSMDSVDIVHGVLNLLSGWFPFQVKCRLYWQVGSTNSPAHPDFFSYFFFCFYPSP